MPMIYPCANSWCNGTTDRPGKFCSKCQPKPVKKQDEKAERWSIWNRHKGAEHEKHGKADE